MNKYKVTTRLHSGRSFSIMRRKDWLPSTYKVLFLPFTDGFMLDEGHLYVQTVEISPDSGDDPTTDINTIRAGLVSVTPLAASRTEMRVFEKLQAIQSLII